MKPNEKKPHETSSLPPSLSRGEWIYGRRSVTEFLKTKPKAQDIKKIFMSPKLPAELKKQIKTELKNAPFCEVSLKELDRLFPKIHHQGLLLNLRVFENQLSSIAASSRNWKDHVSASGGPLLLLDSIQDPHNLGSIIRSAEALGVKALFITGKGVGLSDVVHRTSVGASFHLPIFSFVNLYSLNSVLKKMGFWICATAEDEQKEKAYAGKNRKEKRPLCLKHTQIEGLPPTKELALIIGHEGYGIKKIILEQSDFVLSIPLSGKISSLNAGVAAGILIDRLLHREEKIKA